MKLLDAALYFRTSRASAALLALLVAAGRVLSFAQERSNRMRRFIVVVRAYQKGEGVNSISSRLGCSRTTVLRYARLAGLPLRPKHFPEKIRSAVLRDYLKQNPKMSVAEIARMHEVSQAYVSKVARESGVLRYKVKQS